LGLGAPFLAGTIDLLCFVHAREGAGESGWRGRGNAYVAYGTKRLARSGQAGNQLVVLVIGDWFVKSSMKIDFLEDQFPNHHQYANTDN
jgi:hypothetical protein